MKSLNPSRFFSTMLTVILTVWVLMFSPASVAIAQNRSMNSLGHSSNAECVRLGCFHDHCHLNESLEAVVRACQGNVETSCIRSLCLQRGDCAMLSRFVSYAEMCRF